MSTATTTTPDTATLWRLIVQAGGMTAYIDAQLRERGFLVDAARRGRDVRPREGLVQEGAQAGSRGAAEAAPRDVGRVQGEPHRPPRRRRVLDRRAESGQVGHAQQRGARGRERTAGARQAGATRRSARRHDPATARAWPTTATRPRRSTTSGSPSRSATAPSGPSGHRRSGSRRRSGGFCTTSSSGCRSTARRKASSSGGPSSATRQVHENPKVLLKMDIKEFFPTVTWRRVKGVFRRAGYRERHQHAARARLHRSAARDRAPSKARPTTSRSGRGACRKVRRPARDHERAVPAARPPARGSGEAVRLALHPLRRRPDFQPAARAQGTRRNSAR